MDDRIEDKVVLITGANSGVGFATARGIAERGAAVVIVCRDPARGAAARDEAANWGSLNKVDLRSERRHEA